MKELIQRMRLRLTGNRKVFIFLKLLFAIPAIALLLMVFLYVVGVIGTLVVVWMRFPERARIAKVHGDLMMIIEASGM
jgi:hypothetical protein